MADGTIVNENDRTGQLDLEGEIMRAAAAVTETTGTERTADSGITALQQSIETFTRPANGRENSYSAVLSTTIATPRPGKSGPFIQARRTLSPFMMIAPGLNLHQSFRGKKPGYSTFIPAPSKQRGAGGITIDRGKLAIYSAYGGGLRDVKTRLGKGTKLSVTMLDPALLAALHKEKTEMQTPNIVPGADKLNAEDYRKLKDLPSHLDRRSDQNTTAQAMHRSQQPLKGPGM